MTEQPDRRRASDADLDARLCEQDTRSDWQDQINKARFRKLGALVRATYVALAVTALCIGIIGTFMFASVRRTDAATGRANAAADCANLLLVSVAEQAIDPRAQALKCDTTVAQSLIERGQRRDKAAAAATAEVEAQRAQLHDDTCKLLDAVLQPPPSPALLQFKKDYRCP